MSHIRVDDEDNYEPTDSDEDYTENERILLNKVRSKPFNNSDSEEEVFGVGSASDDDKSDIALSDVEGQEEDDDLPDARAWGKDKRKFYSTDYVDPDYGGFQGKDAHLAELEEEEARNLQNLLAQQLDDDDFTLDISPNKDVEEPSKISEEIIKSDISKLSKRQLLQILQKESPEFFGLLGDFHGKMTLVRDHLGPILQKYKKGQMSNSKVIEFITTQHELILNYCVNIFMYLLLKALRVNIQIHPVVKRLYQYRQLLSQLDPVFNELVKPQIKILLNEDSTEKETKTLNILKQVMNKGGKRKQNSSRGEMPSKKVKFNFTAPEESNVNSNEEPAKDEEVGKRAITYKMAKNKGLTPHRKKEQRNPRVKHRNKFRKAKIRRKGAVREPRTELRRYGGESSGIKAGVTKSIKIKS